MKKYYVTYGFGSNLAKCYSVVQAPDYETAREHIHTVTNGQFAFCYDEQLFAGQAETYGLREVPLQAQISLG